MSKIPVQRRIIKSVIKKAQNAQFYAIIICIVLIAGILSQCTFASPTSSVVITSAGQIAPFRGYYNVTAASGSPGDIQAAVNNVEANGTYPSAGCGNVFIPAGTFNWGNVTVNINGGVNIFGASAAGCDSHLNNWTTFTPTTILNSTVAPPNLPNMLYVSGTDKLPSRISGIEFIATAPSTGSIENQGEGEAIVTTMLENFRIDHCTFINFDEDAVFIDSSAGLANSPGSYGVIDNCYVYDPYKLTPPTDGGGWSWGGGFYSRGGMKPDLSGSWDSNIADFAGVYGVVTNTTIMYVEDCSFNYSDQCVDGIQGSWNVVRFNLCENATPPWGDIQIHGSQTWYGARGMEVYNNTIIDVPNLQGISPQDLGGIRQRGGSALVFNNTVTYTQNITGQCFMVLDDYDNQVAFPFTDINSTYIWNNAYTNCTFLNVLEGTLNVNYFLRAPNQAQDGFTYTPYPYPIFSVDTP